MYSSFSCLKKIISAIILALPIISCSTNTDGLIELNSEGKWNEAGLSEISINNLNQFNGAIYAATDSGLYQTNTKESLIEWAKKGLQQKRVLNVISLSQRKILAAVDIADFSSGIPSLFLSADMGQNWHAYMQNFGGESGKYTYISSFTSTSVHSDTILAHASGGGTIARSIDGGNQWNIVSGDWDLYGGLGVLLKADPYYSRRIWAGGVNGFTKPYLLKSLDFGKTWESLNGLGSTEKVCYDVLSHPDDKNTILVGFSGGFLKALQIRKSSDNGKTWHIVHDSLGIYTFAQSPRDGHRVYASGINQSGTLFFAASADFGDTWQTIKMPDSPAGVQVNDMISVMENGHEVLYFGTNRGVFSYTFEE